MAESTVRTIDLRCLERWEAKRGLPPLRHMGVDEIYRGKKDKFLTVVCNLETESRCGLVIHGRKQRWMNSFVAS